MSTLIIGGVILFLIFMAFVGGPSFGPGPKTSGTAPDLNDPSLVTDAQIYREFEVCMNEAKKTVGDDKMKGQAIAANCMMGLKKYGDARAKKAFAFYFDLKQ